MSNVVPSALAELSSGWGGDPERTEMHWLLQHPYGRDLLACQLRKSRPAVEFEHYCLGPEIHPQLEEMVDQLGLREWRRPATLWDPLESTCRHASLSIL